MCRLQFSGNPPGYKPRIWERFTVTDIQRHGMVLLFRKLLMLILKISMIRMMCFASWFLSGNWSFTSVKCLGGLLFSSRTVAVSIRMFSSMLVQKIMVAWVRDRFKWISFIIVVWRRRWIYLISSRNGDSWHLWTGRLKIMIRKLWKLPKKWLMNWKRK